MLGQWVLNVVAAVRSSGGKSNTLVRLVNGQKAFLPRNKQVSTNSIARSKDYKEVAWTPEPIVL